MTTNPVLNTTAEQIEVLKAVIEKKPVYFVNPNVPGQMREAFRGILPNFNVYRYECDTTTVRGRVKFKQSKLFRGVAEASSLAAEYARSAPLDGDADTLEAWYEGEQLNLRVLSPAPIVFHGFVHPEKIDRQPVALPASKPVGYAHPHVPGKTPSDILANKLRGTLRKEDKFFRTAQLCQTTKKTYRVSVDDNVLSHRRYHIIIVTRDCVLVSVQAHDLHLLRSWHVSTEAKILGDMFVYAGVVFDVHWNK